MTVDKRKKLNKADQEKLLIGFTSLHAKTTETVGKTVEIIDKIVGIISEIKHSLKEIVRYVILLFFIAFFRDEIVQTIKQLIVWSDQYFKYIITGFSQLSHDARYTIAVITLPTAIISFLFGKKIRK